MEPTNNKPQSFSSTSNDGQFSNTTSPEPSPIISQIVHEILEESSDFSSDNESNQEIMPLEKVSVIKYLPISEESSFPKITKENKSSFCLDDNLIRNIFGGFTPSFVIRSKVVCRLFYRALDPSQMNIYWRARFLRLFEHRVKVENVVVSEHWYDSYKAMFIQIKKKQEEARSNAALIGAGVALGGLALKLCIRKKDSKKNDNVESGGLLGILANLAVGIGAAVALAASSTKSEIEEFISEDSEESLESEDSLINNDDKSEELDPVNQIVKSNGDR